MKLTVRDCLDALLCTSLSVSMSSIEDEGRISFGTGSDSRFRIEARHEGTSSDSFDLMYDRTESRTDLLEYSRSEKSVSSDCFAPLLYDVLCRENREYRLDNLLEFDDK